MESQLIDPQWFFITFGVIVVGVGALMWWAGVIKKR
jgi:hypothetical protein